jgi:hypothetical protein
MPLPGENAMKKLPKEKRDQLILVLLLIAGGAAGLWFGVINFQNRHLRRLHIEKQNAELKLADWDKLIKNADRIETELSGAAKKLADLEEDMASGDLYLWLVKNIRTFKSPYKSLDIPQLGQPEVKETTLLPKFPYKQVTLTIGGTSYFHDLGKFIADFENQFPLFRVVNLEMEPAPSVAGADREKLSFKMDVIALVKPGPS